MSPEEKYAMAKVCQSCGMPLSKDPQGGGTEADGSLSDTYCSICYDAGSFRHPDATVLEFQQQCVEALMRSGTPKLMAWLFTRGIPRLARWQT